MSDIKINLGCDIWHISNFINIDINPKVKPDLVLNALDIPKHFENNTVSFIYAGHFFEHLEIEESLEVMEICFKILKPHGCLLSIVPDWRKTAELETDDAADKIVMANGDHKILMSSERLSKMLLKSGFKLVQEIHDLNQVPYLLVPDVNNPKPELWQTAFISLKI